MSEPTVTVKRSTLLRLYQDAEAYVDLQQSFSRHFGSVFVRHDDLPSSDEPNINWGEHDRHQARQDAERILKIGQYAPKPAPPPPPK